MNSNLNQKKISWGNTLFLLGVPALFLVMAPIAIYEGVYYWGFFVYALVHYFLEGLSITAGYHRFISHRAYDSHPIVKLAYLIVGAGAFQNSALKWSVDHRIHHRECDTEEDPYNINKGFFWAHMGWIFYASNSFSMDDVPADLKKDKLLLWQHKYYLPIALLMGVAFPILFCAYFFDSVLGGLVWGVLLRVLFTSHCTYFINSLAHTSGTQEFNLHNSARDNWMISFVTFGEGFHNFHHKFQADYRNGIRWFQWDPTKWLVKGLSFIGLTYNINETPQEKIIAAQMQVREELLRQKGIDLTALNAQREKIVTIQDTLTELRREYRVLKRQKTQKARVALKQLQRNMKKARHEFITAHNDWQIQIKVLSAGLM